mmetsp:Transcript_41362/g.61222  ORF Transcript_41362/g.61222 Transcript_41362/m.61222 type:complete len:112 (-) Transcript_41362:819-1154(-)
MQTSRNIWTSRFPSFFELQYDLSFNMPPIFDLNPLFSFYRHRSKSSALSTNRLLSSCLAERLLGQSWLDQMTAHDAGVIDHKKQRSLLVHPVPTFARVNSFVGGVRQLIGP